MEIVHRIQDGTFFLQHCQHQIFLDGIDQLMIRRESRVMQAIECLDMFLQLW